MAKLSTKSKAWIRRGLLFFDGTILLMAMRFAGISTDLLPGVGIYIAFFCTVPPTTFPMSGMGLVDVLIVAMRIEVAGESPLSALSPE